MGRRDELAQLVRDFDGMAGRIESLVTAQARLLNDVSHELRSPLARLNVSLGLARQRTGPQAEPALDRIEREAERLNELIGRLLTIARLESGADGLEESQVHLEDVLRDITQDADFEAQSLHCRVQCSIGNDCVVPANRDLLYSAIENVVRNAMRYTKEGTTVDIRLDAATGPTGLEACVKVLDSGPGVPEESLDKLFRPFYRLDDARSARTGGVGLGLAITERTVLLHHGRVKAVNRPQGGLMVEISLPAVSSSIPQVLNELNELITEPPAS
jgi:two-component system sensor histidine kinase CpxA